MLLRRSHGTFVSTVGGCWIAFGDETTTDGVGLGPSISWSVKTREALAIVARRDIRTERPGYRA